RPRRPPLPPHRRRPKSRGVRGVPERGRGPGVRARKGPRRLDGATAGLDFPRRPPWSYSMSREELLRREEAAFRGGGALAPFEHNLETWRQLWRVLEMSDIILLIADARHPVSQGPRRPGRGWGGRGPRCPGGLGASPEMGHGTQGAQASGRPRSPPGRCARNLRGGPRRPGAPGAAWDGVRGIRGWGPRHPGILGAPRRWDTGGPGVRVPLEPPGDGMWGSEEGGPGVRAPQEPRGTASEGSERGAQASGCPGSHVGRCPRDPRGGPRRPGVLAGVYPISQLQEPYTAVGYLAARLPLPALLQLGPPTAGAWTAWDICEAWAEKRGYKTAKAARNDVYRAANSILRLAAEGRLRLCLPPPGYAARRGRGPGVRVSSSEEEEEEDSEEEEEGDEC
uniref:GNL1 protein n=1 Tax=Apteryx owenii TaxID=8824 RepID=A0A8B9PGA2_APTOW